MVGIVANFCLFVICGDVLSFGVPQSELITNAKLRSIRVSTMSQRKRRYARQDDFCVRLFFFLTSQYVHLFFEKKSACGGQLREFVSFCLHIVSCKILHIHKVASLKTFDLFYFGDLRVLVGYPIIL